VTLQLDEREVGIDVGPAEPDEVRPLQECRRSRTQPPHRRPGHEVSQQTLPAQGHGHRRWHRRRPVVAQLGGDRAEQHTVD
jgi:hypothetical protein